MLESLVQVLSGIYVGLDPEPFIQVPSGLPIFVALGCDQILLLVRNQSLLVQTPNGICVFLALGYSQRFAVAHDPESFSSNIQWDLCCS